ncbi:MAG: ribonuclease III [Candidatus Kerfeldbacteria bacterium]|nr:ribonuclease III [Candidatus Kerfeldbacteria bacterium]
MDKNIAKLEKTLEVKFSNPNLLRQALVHRSYLNEHRDFPLDHNERLEFLGDAVLELVVTEHLFTTYPNPEGELTNWRASLVNSQMLSIIAEQLEIEQFLYLSRGEAKDSNTKARQSILANAVEAIIGSIYLDKEYDIAATFIHKNIISKLPHILKYKLYLDAKSRFQEAAQELVGATPNYRVQKESGPDHNKIFIVGVYLHDELIATGEGTSKQEAQMKAAEAALHKKNWLTYEHE